MFATENPGDPPLRSVNRGRSTAAPNTAPPLVFRASPPYRDAGRVAVTGGRRNARTSTHPPEGVPRGHRTTRGLSPGANRVAADQSEDSDARRRKTALGGGEGGDDARVHVDERPYIATPKPPTPLEARFTAPTGDDEAKDGRFDSAPPPGLKPTLTSGGSRRGESAWRDVLPTTDVASERPSSETGARTGVEPPSAGVIETPGDEGPSPSRSRPPVVFAAEDPFATPQGEIAGVVAAERASSLVDGGIRASPSPGVAGTGAERPNRNEAASPNDAFVASSSSSSSPINPFASTTRLDSSEADRSARSASVSLVQFNTHAGAETTTRTVPCSSLDASTRTLTAAPATSGGARPSDPESERREATNTSRTAEKKVPSSSEGTTRGNATVSQWVYPCGRRWSVTA